MTVLLDRTLTWPLVATGRRLAGSRRPVRPTALDRYKSVAGAAPIPKSPVTCEIESSERLRLTRAAADQRGAKAPAELKMHYLVAMTSGEQQGPSFRAAPTDGFFSAAEPPRRKIGRLKYRSSKLGV